MDGGLVALALSGGVNVWGEFPGNTRAQYINGLTTFLLKAGWRLDQRVKAFATGTYDRNTNFADADGFNAGGLTYTFKTVIDNEISRQVLIGADRDASLANLVAAIAIGAGQGTTFSNATIVNPLVRGSLTIVNDDDIDMTITAKRAGADGNGIPSTVGTLIYGGYRVIGESPQTRFDEPTEQLTVKGYVYDRNVTSSSHKLSQVRLSSTDDPDVQLSENGVEVKADRRFRVVANRCQFFVYVEGAAADPWGSVVAGGIPWVPSSEVCGDEVPAVPANEVFWSSQDGGLSVNTTPRTSIVKEGHYSTWYDDMDPHQYSKTIFDANGWNRSDGSFNGQTTLGSQVEANDDEGQFRMISLAPPDHWDFVINAFDGKALVNSMLWAGAERTMKLEPLIAWGPANDAEPRIRGQLYDAWIITGQVPMDTVRRFDGNYWLAFSNLVKFGTLWLLVPSLEPEQIETLQASYAH